jgi:TonB family protein
VIGLDRFYLQLIADFWGRILVRCMITRERTTHLVAVALVGYATLSNTRASEHLTADQVRQWAISMPKPEYPESARLRGATGSGFFKLRVQIRTGRVRQITTLRSTGDKTLDAAAIETLSRWRFKPNALPSIRKLDPNTKEPFADEDTFIGVPVIFTPFAAAPESAKHGPYPVAQKVPGAPGFVYNPYARGKQVLDVRGLPPGTEMKDPTSGKIYIVP